MNAFLHRLGTALARKLTLTAAAQRHGTRDETERLTAIVRPADVLLVEGRGRFGQVIRTLTQSTWSHSALVVPLDDAPGLGLVEADVVDGVRHVTLLATPA
jgi:hypothetical protein